LEAAAFVEKTDEMVTTKRDEQRNGEQRSGRLAQAAQGKQPEAETEATEQRQLLYLSPKGVR
jgi:hypothetical protein